jgi:hypothetical protein
MTPKERDKFSLTSDDIVAWIRDVFEPEFTAIDQAFQQEQKMGHKN